jgi:flagellar biosynthesis protein FlhF
MSMRLKSYFADTIEAAMTLAARELGEDAMLVYSREASAEAKYLGNYEVVFGTGETEIPPNLHLPPQDISPLSSIATKPAGTGQAVSEQLTWASAALSELKSEIGFLRQDVASHRRCMEELLTYNDRRAWRLLADWGSEPELLPGVALAGRLLQADMDPEHVLEVIECTRDAVRALEGADGVRSGSEVWRKSLERELVDRRRCNWRLGVPGKSDTIVLIGPPGVGRTTVAMHLAAHATAKGMEPKLIAFEPGRLTAAQVLRSYAAVLGAPFELARRSDHLATLLSSRDSGSLTIVDGPGLGPSPDDGSAQLSAYCSMPRQSETWLVLPATSRASDLRLLIQRFAAYGPTRLIFTHTAETRHWGAIWSAAEWAGLPLGFFCLGPRIPEDLKPASAEALSAYLIAHTGVPNYEPVDRRENRRLAGGAGAGGRG